MLTNVILEFLHPNTILFDVWNVNISIYSETSGIYMSLNLEPFKPFEPSKLEAF